MLQLSTESYSMNQSKLETRDECINTLNGDKLMQLQSLGRQLSQIANDFHSLVIHSDQTECSFVN